MPRALPFACLLLAAAPATAGTPGALRYGAVPGGSGGRPVLLFLHGWNSDASTWSGSNEMESRATAAGYRTAFLDLHPDQSMWTNAPLIATAVDAVKARFAAPVVLVCHSKGGVDAQTAAIYSGVGAKVDRILTLGTPHRGTPLADLAWSTWTGWLAALLGSRNEGNRVLQTGYMAAFRAQADARPEARATPLYTAGGTRAGGFFTAYYWGGLAIGRTSDGVVPLDSSDLPYRRGRLFTQAWNHDEVHQGRNAWAYLAGNLAAPALKEPEAPEPGTSEAGAATAEACPALDRLYRGGPTEAGMAHATFPVDAGQPGLALLLQTSKPPREAWAVSPSGRLVAFRTVAGPPLHRLGRSYAEADPDGEGVETGRSMDPDAVLPGAVVLHAEVAAPEAGTWRLHLAADGEDAFFLTARFPGDAGRVLEPGRLAAALRAPAGEGRSTLRVLPPPALRPGGFHEPVVLNHSLTLQDGPGRERCVALSAAEEAGRPAD